MSITIRWRLAIVSLAAIPVGGAALIALLALGLADPPRAGSLQWQATAPEEWPQQTISPDLQFLRAPHDLPPAFTLELTARNGGSPDSAWGIQFWNTEISTTILIDNQGYTSIGPFDPAWEQFLHMRAHEDNTLYLHVSPDGKAALRINDEILRDKIDFSAPVDRWGIVTYRRPQLAWSRIALYYQ